MRTKPLPCPFCGSCPFHIHDEDGLTRIGCEGCSIMPRAVDTDRDRVVSDWNKRAHWNGGPLVDNLLEIIANAADVIEGRITTDLNRERNANSIRQAAGLPVKIGFGR